MSIFLKWFYKLKQSNQTLKITKPDNLLQNSYKNPKIETFNKAQCSKTDQNTRA